MKNLKHWSELTAINIITALAGVFLLGSPWLFGFHPKSYSLQHGWVMNRKPGAMVRNTLKYQRVDVARREAARAEWNRPVLWPLLLTFALLAALVAPAVMHWRRRERATAAAGAH